MNSPSHFLKYKLKNAIDNNNPNNNLKFELNYVSNILNSLASSFRQNIDKNAEYENNFYEKEASALSNFKFLKTSKSRNSFSNNTSSKIKNTNLNIKYSDLNSNINSNLKDFLSSIENIKTKRQKFLDVKQPKRESYFSKMSRTPMADNTHLKLNNNNEKTKGNTRASLFLNYAKDYNKSPKCRRVSTINQLYANTNIQQYDYYNNNQKVYKINENIQNELESKELKKKVNLMKKTIIQSTSTKDLEKLLEEDDKGPSKLKKSEIKKNKEKLLEKIDKMNKESKESSKISISIKSNLDKKDERHRKLKRIKEIFDSFDDEEYEEENEDDYYISPSSYFIKVFDCTMFFSCMFYLIYVPFYFSNNTILKGDNKFALVLLSVIDAIYIIDIIINFFRAYQNFDENLVRKTKYIFLHYLKTWFLFDFIQAFPFYTLFKFIERDYINFNISSLEGYSLNRINPRLYLLILIKIVKVYKMLKQNNTLSSIGEFLSKIEFIDNYRYILFSIFYSLCFLNICSCLYIFIGRNTFPGWIMKIHLKDVSYINVYVASLYFILVTITTVGYGDITGNTYIEIIFQMFLLIIGTLAYSFVISYISNYIIKKNQKTLAFEKNVNILKEIKMHNPDLKDCIYHECIKNLFNEQLYERKDKSILFDCLPYSLKNKLIMEMYKPFIKNFIFFKFIENSDFIVKVVTSLKPLLSFKENILIQEGDFIKEIFFVKKGALILNISIDKENIEDSLKKYIDVNELGTIKITYMPTLMLNNCPTLNLDDNFDNYFMHKKTNKIKENNSLDIQEIKIIEIRKNEHFGDALMFLNERSPLLVKVKTKVAELLVLRKMEAIEIYSIYPNIWKRINKKSLFNMEQIKIKIKNILFSLAKKYGSEAERNILQNSKSLNRFISLKSFNENAVNEEDSQIGNTENNKKKNKKKKQKSRIHNNDIKYTIKLHTIEEKEENSPVKTYIVEEKEEEKQTNSNDNNDNSNSSKKNNNLLLKFNSTNIKKTLKESEKTLILVNQSKRDNKSNIDKEESPYSKKNEDKDCFVKTSSDSSSSKSIESQKKTSINKEIEKDKEENKNSNKNIKRKIQKNLSVPLHFKLNSDKNSNIPQNTSISINQIQKSMVTKSENLYSPSFSNLSTTNEKSFELISSYENINKITNNIYMKNLTLQTKTKQFLINECSSLSNDSPKEKFRISKNHFNGKRIIRKRTSKRLTGEIKLEDDNNSINSLDLTKLPSKKNIEKINEFSNKDKKDEHKIKRHESTKNLLEKKQSRANINVIEMINKKQTKTNVKRRRKSELLNVNKKLNMISKNIQGANKNINNPEEFYMDFFNNIIKQETGGIEKFDDKSNTNNNIKENTDVINKAEKKDLISNEKNSPNHKKNCSIISDDAKFKKIKISKKISKMNFQYQS